MKTPVHLHWLWRRGAREMAGVTLAGAACGVTGLSPSLVTASPEAATCAKCAAIGKRPAEPPALAPAPKGKQPRAARPLPAGADTVTLQQLADSLGVRKRDVRRACRAARIQLPSRIPTEMTARVREAVSAATTRGQ